jgi:hypothetical protein
MENFATVLQSYTEVGILGLLAILVIILVWRSFDRKGKDDDWKKEKIDDKDKVIVGDKDYLSNQVAKLSDMVQENNKEFREFQTQVLSNNQVVTQQLIDKIIEGVYYHVPSIDENNKLTDVNVELDTILKEMLIELDASRVNIVQYHNGGKGINRQAFLKMSMTNEQIQVNVKPFMQEFKDQFRSVLGYFVNELNNSGKCYITNVDDMLEKDIGMYEFMKNRGIEAKFGYAIHDRNKCVVAFVCAEYEDKSKVDIEKIDTSFKEHYKEIERLLNA